MNGSEYGYDSGGGQGQGQDWWDEWYEKMLNMLRGRFTEPERPDIKVPGIDPFEYVPGEYSQDLWKMWQEKGRMTPNPWDLTDWMGRLREYGPPGNVPLAPERGMPGVTGTSNIDVGLQKRLEEAQRAYGAGGRGSYSFGAGWSQDRIGNLVQSLQGQIDAAYRGKQSETQQYLAELQGYGQELAGHQAGYGQLADQMGQAWRRKGMGMQGLQQLMNLATQAGATTQRSTVQAELGSAGLQQQEWQSALGGLRGFRGQDIDLLMKKLEMEMRAAQARAAAGGQETNFWDILGGLAPYLFMFL